MRLLIFTQKVDKNDSVLGFFHGWITEISNNFESVEVICLEKGEYNLPKNVTVYSLGKERGISKISYIVNLYKYLFLIKGSYDRVFVHMNQEYILLAGLYWKILNIPVYLWRNHKDGSILTRIAVILSTKLFCTSTDSFTARFNNAVIMPAGIDTGVFRPISGVVRKKYSVCMVGRIAPIKHIEMALSAINTMILSGEQVSLTIVGSYLERDRHYYESVKKLASESTIASYVQFVEGVSFDKLPEIYSSHEVCLNFTDSGSFDKTIVESASCGAIPLVSNKSLQKLIPEKCFTEAEPEIIATKIKILLEPHEQIEIQDELSEFVKSQSLSTLVKKLLIEMK